MRPSNRTTANQRAAALITCWNQDICGSRWIVNGYGDEDYVTVVARGIATAMAPLVDHQAGYVNASELELLHEDYGSGDYPKMAGIVKMSERC